MFITVAAATLPSVPLDFQGNRDRILESIRIAKAQGATIRVGPELEVPGEQILLNSCRRNPRGMLTWLAKRLWMS